MTVIGVDISGQVGQDPPVYCVAVKLTRRNTQTHNTVCLSKTKHDEYANCARNWVEKISSALIYRAVIDFSPPLYTSNDVIFIDVDFEGKRRTHVEHCLKRLFGERFYGHYPLNNPTIKFIPAQLDRNVKKADVKSKMARHRDMPYNVKDPDFTTELSWLSKL
jgi:hypothetical protein